MFLHFHSSSTLTCHTKFETFPKEDSYRPIVPAQSRLVVVPGAWYHTASASPFWWTAHSLVVRTLGIIADGGVALRLWGLRSLLGSSTWSNSLITGDYPAASVHTVFQKMCKTVPQLQFFCNNIRLFVHLHTWDHDWKASYSSGDVISARWPPAYWQMYCASSRCAWYKSDTS